MSLFLGVFILVVVFFSITGYNKGFFGALSRTVSLLAAYVAAFFLVKPTADLLQIHTQLDGMVVYLIAGLVIFTLVSLLVTALFRVLDKIVINRQGLSLLSKIGGLLVGTLMGCLFGLMTVYGLSIVQEIRQTDPQAQRTSIETNARQMTAKLIAAVTTLAYPGAAAFTESFAKSPITMGKSMLGVADNPDLKSLINNPRYQHMLERGDTAALVDDPRFKRLSENSDVQYFLQQSQLIPENIENNEALAEALVNGWQGLQTVRNNPRVQEIINDPDFQKKLQSENKFVLMNDPKFKELTEAFFQAIANTRATTSTRD